MVKKYRVEFLPAAISDLNKLDKVISQRILNKIGWLAKNFEDIIPEVLAYDLKGMFKLRVGDWRVIYTVTQKTRLITIHLIGHRRKIYNI